MTDIVYEIGVCVIAIILYAIPILTACSFIYEWDGFFQVILIVASMIEFCGLCILIADKVNGREE